MAHMVFEGETYYVPDGYAEPDWTEYDRLHNWRNHIPNYVQSMWSTFTDDQKIRLAAWAESLANAEDWDW